MGNRFGRKKTLRFKKENESNPSRPPLKLRGGEGGVMSRGNGHLWCGPGGHYISIDVCIVRQTRQPGNCKVCEYNTPESVQAGEKEVA